MKILFSKTSIPIMLAILVSAFCVFADSNPSAAETSPEWFPFTKEIAITVTADTLSGVDTLTAISKFTPDPQYQYHYQWMRPTGTGTDSLVILFEMICYSSADSVIGIFVIDSLTDSTSKSVRLPIDTKHFAPGGIACRFRSLTGTGSQVILGHRARLKREFRRRR